jgi:hypothetical protein
MRKKKTFLKIVSNLETLSGAKRNQRKIGPGLTFSLSLRRIFRLIPMQNRYKGPYRT